MAPYLGPTLTAREIARSASNLSGVTRSALMWIRAWRVPRLYGRSIECATEQLVGPSLEALLAAALPGMHWQWRIDEVAPPLRKYGILHALLSAPIDETTGAPMALEVCGEVVRAGTYQLGRDMSFFAGRYASTQDPHDMPLSGPIEIRIHGAAYSNVAWLGVDVPFYF